MSFKNSVIFLVMSAFFSGCATTTPTIPTVNDNEAIKYENEYLSEYESLKKNFSNSPTIKWVQPSNKNEPCKVYVGIDPNKDKTVDENYKIFWDGDCKDGYAYGLGREFERGTVLNMEALAIYQGASIKPQYYIQKYNLDNKTQEGDISNSYFVETTITDENFNFNINYVSGFMGSSTQPFRLITYSSPFDDNIVLQKDYPNFSYRMLDMSNNEFEQRKFQFEMRGSNGKQNYYGFTTPKYGQTASGEVIDGKIIRRVQLPESYFTKIGQIFNEVLQASEKAKKAQKESLIVKKQYINKICKDSVRVSFIDNSEYKSICNESENNNLKEKIENKFTQINSQKQQKREQMNQQKIVDAQVVQAEAEQRQAAAAARSAAAAEQANNIQSWQNLNNQIQNTTNQILQQTNSYSYPTIAPFSGLNTLNSRKLQTCYTAGGIEFCN